MSFGRVNYRSWLLRILTWDTLLPASVGLVPIGVELLFPKHRGVMEVVSVTLPIVAFFLRIRAGKRQIQSNRCSEAMHRFQFFIFVLGILPLVLVDCFMILSHLMPKGAMFATKADLLVWASIFAIYLTSMAVAMYPGSPESNRVEGGLMYFADVSLTGPVKYGEVPGSIGVFESQDSFMPIGEADCLSWDENGLAVWTLRIGGYPIEGRWVIIDRRFRPAQ